METLDADGVDVAIVGGGVVGVALAEAAARAGHSVLLLEAGAQLGAGITSRNSGVIHSGLYYPPGSLKALTCVEGNRRLYAWAAAHGVWHRKCGKLVVAQDEAQRPALAALAANAAAAGAPGVSMIDGAQAKALEPSLGAIAALHCRETGIIDPHELVLSLRADAEAAGAHVVTGARVEAVEGARGGFTLTTTRGPITTERLVNAAGLHADAVARLCGVDRFRIHPCRGDYFRLRSQIAYQHLIYPVKDPAQPGLGIHLTLERGGGLRLGPDASYVDACDDFADPSPAALAAKHAAFLAAARRLLGPLAPEQLSYDGCGIRPKLRAPTDPAERDFVLEEDPPGVIHLVGIESPGLTAALALAARVTARL